MNRDLFLFKLEQLLYDIPKEERDEAMDYYRGYFDDAGAENEAVVLEELESPQAIADSIKEALRSTGDMSGGLKNPPQVRDGRDQAGSAEDIKAFFQEVIFKRASKSSTRGRILPEKTNGRGSKKRHRAQPTGGMTSTAALQAAEGHFLRTEAPSGFCL